MFIRFKYDKICKNRTDFKNGHVFRSGTAANKQKKKMLCEEAPEYSTEENDTLF